MYGRAGYSNNQSTVRKGHVLGINQGGTSQIDNAFGLVAAGILKIIEVKVVDSTPAVSGTTNSMANPTP